MNKLVKAIKDPRAALSVLVRKLGKNLDDEAYLRLMYLAYYSKRLNLDAPKDYSEKMQWLKLNHRRPVYTRMADKYAVKELVSNAIGSEYVIPCYGLWDRFDEIPFNLLPDSFVLKCTHDSGSFAICNDKKSFDKEVARAKLERGLAQNFFQVFREWPYKDIKPRIIAEEYIPSLGHPESVEYKITCCGGEVKFVTVCGGIAHSDYALRSNDHYTKDWKRLDWYAFYKPKGGDIPKTGQIEEMIELSEKLTAGIPYVRVDWYVVDGRVYFGEFTFYTWAGFLRFTPRKWDRILGDMIKLPEADNC